MKVSSVPPPKLDPLTPSSVNTSGLNAGTTVTLSPSSPCSVVENSDGTLTVSFLIDEPATIGRLRRRLNGVPIARYLWDNILRRAIDTHVF